MNSGHPSPARALPVLDIRLTGRGENAVRMEKRLRCAARGLGVSVRIDWRTGEYGEPVVTVGDQIVCDHLVHTAELETLLEPFVEQIRET